MDINALHIDLPQWQGDLLVMGCYEQEETFVLPAPLTDLAPEITTLLTELIAEEEFTGKTGSSFVARLGSGAPVKKIALVGLGKAADCDLNALRQGAAAIARLAKGTKLARVALGLPPSDANPEAQSQMIAEGIWLALHSDRRFKSEEDKNPCKIETFELLDGDQGGIERGTHIAQGVIFARELVNAPANVIDPITLTQAVQTLAQDHGLNLKILEQSDCEALNMGAFLGVAKASDLPPKFLHLTYTPAGTPRKKLAIVGKGLTFDSGGYNIKPSGSGIETMKMDMGGAAAIFGAAKAIAQLKPDVEVHFISAVTENMISGRGMRPGDVLTASNGKTIEVNNTDAEGRLTLADALVYADQLGADALVDLATLTGACVVALGNDIAGFWSNDDTLATGLKTASTAVGEKIWQMPLEEDYWKVMKSGCADMKNTGSRGGGAITAALFLKQFVEKTPWAHIDIAGPVWSDKDNGILGQGGTGFPVRTLIHWIIS